MLIIKGNLEKLKNSEFYNSECWDYPKSEINMLKEDENYSDVVYLIAENRVYETLCEMHDINKLIKEVDGEIFYLTSKEQNKVLEDIVELFMNDSDKQALQKLYEITNDKLVKILLYWNEDYQEFIGIPCTYANDMYEDIMNYVWEKYNLQEIEETKDRNNVIEDELEGE